MLVLGGILNKPVVINGNIFVKAVKGKNGDLKLAIEAPKDVKIVRGDLFPGMEEVEKRWESTLKKA